MNSGRTTAVKGGTGIESTPANNIGGDRRGSNSSGGMFSGLMNQKRNSIDASAAARRSSFNEMKPAPGVIGQMWHKYVSTHAITVPILMNSVPSFTKGSSG